MLCVLSVNYLLTVTALYYFAWPRYWQWSLKIHLMVKYSSHIFSDEEASTDHDLREHILSKLALFATLQKHIGVVFHNAVQERFQEDPTLFEQHTPFSSKVMLGISRLLSSE